MKRTSKQTIIFVTCLVTLSIVLTSGDLFKGDPHNSESGKTKCLELAELSTSDFTSPLTLNYNLSQLSNYPGFPYQPDLNELQSMHGMSPVGSFALISYNDILKYGYMYSYLSNPSKRPSIEVVQTGADCSGELRQTFLTEAQVRGNTLPNVYMLGASTATFTVTIKTIETQNNNVRVVWQTTTSNPYGEWFLQNQEGKILVNGTTFTNVSSSEAACRIETIDTKTSNISTKIKVVPNTIGEEMNGMETLILRKKDMKVYISPELEQPVYYNGKFDDKYSWDAPDVIMDILK